MLWRWRKPEEKASGKTEGGEKAYETGGKRRNSPGSLHGGIKRWLIPKRLAFTYIFHSAEAAGIIAAFIL